MSQAVDNGPRLGFSVNGGTASVSGPGERLLTVPEAEESTRIAKLARQHSCRRKTLCWLLLLDAVLNMSLIGAAFAFSLANIADAAALTAYSLAKSPFDSVGLSAARWLVLAPIALSSSIGSRLPATTVALDADFPSDFRAPSRSRDGPKLILPYVGMLLMAPAAQILTAAKIKRCNYFTCRHLL